MVPKGILIQEKTWSRKSRVRLPLKMLPSIQYFCITPDTYLTLIICCIFCQARFMIFSTLFCPVLTDNCPVICSDREVHSCVGWPLATGGYADRHLALRKRRVTGQAVFVLFYVQIKKNFFYVHSLLTVMYTLRHKQLPCHSNIYTPSCLQQLTHTHTAI